MSYMNKLFIESIRGTPYRKVIKTFNYLTEDLTVISVPSGFITDFASIPFPLKFFIDPDEGGLREASVIHDYLYSKEFSNIEIKRKRADNIFKEAMIDSGYSNLKAYIIYLTVRLLGRFYYRR